MRYPIVLAHGIARFDVLLRDLLRDEDMSDDRTHYFRRIRSTLQGAGFPTYHSSVPWAESVAVRSRALRANVEQVLAATGAQKVHIIGHSMGGLDARHMLFDGRADGIHERVASLTTIGTPHWARRSPTGASPARSCCWRSCRRWGSPPSTGFAI